jgi:rRNA-processing protein FCF1
MKKVLVDTNFLVYCVNKKIDFFEFCQLNGVSIIIPFEVLMEINRLITSPKSALVNSLKVVKKIIEKEKYEEVSIKGKYVDSGIINYLKKNPEIFLATMDEKLQKLVKNKLVKIRGNRIEDF